MVSRSRIRTIFSNKCCFLWLLSFGFLLASFSLVYGEIFVSQPEDPLIVSTKARLHLILLKLQDREGVELLLGKGWRNPDGSVTYSLDPLGTSLDAEGYVSTVIVEYAANNTIAKVVMSSGDRDLKKGGARQLKISFKD